MRRERSVSPLGSPSRPASLVDKICLYKKLNLVAFAGTLVYVGYVVGSLDNGNASNLSFGSSADYSGSEDGRRAGGLGAATGSSRDAPEGWGRIRGGGGGPRDEERRAAREEEEGRPAGRDEGREETKSAPVLYARGPVVYEGEGPVTSINLLGERHSGTNWITDHLRDCFGDRIPVQSNFTRFKHWFQFDDPHVRNGSALVVAMFRDPYDWVEAMRIEPHHAHDHVNLTWRDFVSKPWTGDRGDADTAMMDKAKEEGRGAVRGLHGCLAGYRFEEVVPCSASDSVELEGYSNYMYELRPDASSRAYASVVELRAAKILNFLRVPSFKGVRAFLPQRYEALSLRGTSDFLRQVEEVTGLTAKCKPFEGTGVVRHKDVDPDFVEWMNRHHDWGPEEMAGYHRRETERP